METLRKKGLPFSIVELKVKDITAPCQPDGEVTTIDDDTKEAICRCKKKPEGCLVDSKNKVLQDKFTVIYHN